MGTDIRTIFSPIDGQISRYEDLLKDILRTDSEFIYQVTDHLFSHPGKLLRPGLLFLSAGRASNSEQVTYAAVAIELIHMATLLHDDVVDQSDTRRGSETVNSRWNNLVAVLMGDYLFAKSFKLLVKSGSPGILERFAAATERVSIGELNQVYLTGNFDINEQQYLNVITDKTASLFACACESGAICDGGDPEKIKALHEFGKNLGIAFQIADDLLDLIGEPAKTGKQLGSDIREGWLTLPMIYALKNGGGSYRKEIEKLYNHGFSEAGLDQIVSFVRKAGGIDYADQQARKYGQIAKDAISKLDGFDYRDNLIQLADFAAVREK